MHLTVELKDSSISMLYKLGNGFVKEAHYGLALARVMNLPPKVLEVAEHVSKTLEDQIEAKRKSSKSYAVLQRRKLLLQLKAQLESLANGSMEEKPLRAFLKKLQNEFVVRMEAIEAAIAEGSSDEDEEMESTTADGKEKAKIIEISSDSEEGSVDQETSMLV